MYAVQWLVLIFQFLHTWQNLEEWNWVNAHMEDACLLLMLNMHDM